MKRLTQFFLMLSTATALAHEPVYTTAEFRSEFAAVNFEPNSTKLTPQSSAALDSVAVILKRNPEQHRYEVHGHTCPDAETADASARSSVQRVEAMVKYLRSNGVPTANITTVINPPAGITAAGCTRDRRVEIMLVETRQVEVKPEPVAVTEPSSPARTVEDVMEDGRKRTAPESITPPPASEPKLTEIAAEQGKQAVAIYMAGDEPKGAQGVHKIMGGELARVISGSESYLAVDRTEIILEQLAKEHTYQRSGAVDDDQIKALGQQLGVQYLCISDINPVGKRYYLDTRLVDVVSAEIMRSVTETSALKDAEDMSRIARSIALELIEPEATRNARLLRKKIFRYTAIGLDILGAGMLAYGYYEETNVAKYVDESAKEPEAESAAKRRNAAYIVGGAILTSGITIHIFF
ncbi:MAG: OmpA family protein [Chitinispirillia bacterium]|nr:OmpA family protein [Chitinispirillia bacterium]MCL2241528.1 OmpA family protein [Chitinispirillia bacterium]